LVLNPAEGCGLRRPENSLPLTALKVIGFIQVNGGAGLSTVSTNLAGELSKSGKTVLFYRDLPQGSSA
jgi:Mrp family chromosome partitioning ATPase